MISSSEYNRLIKLPVEQLTSKQLVEIVEYRELAYESAPRFKDNPDFTPVKEFIEGTMQRLQETAHPGSDNEYYLFETVVDVLFEDPSGFWEWYNRLVE